MSTLFANFLSGVVDDDPLLIGATTLTSSGLASLPTVASPDTMWIVLDPEAGAGAPEIVQVTTHTASATTATIVRAQQSTTARQHAQNTVWRVAATAADLDTFFAITEDGAIDTANLADEAVELGKIDTAAYSPNSVDAESKLVQKGADGLMRSVGPPHGQHPRPEQRLRRRFGRYRG